MDAIGNNSKRNIVVIGASAGGIEALRAFFSHLPPQPTATFFVVQHLAPYYTSELDRILQKVTAMPVAFAMDRQNISTNTVYVAPPDRHLAVEGNVLRVTRGPKECRARPAIDVLFRSAALAFGPRVIGVVLTGALDDGTAGLWQIKERRGLVFVQDPEEAEYSSMPNSVIEHVEVDYVGTIQSLAVKIMQETVKEQALLNAAVPRFGLQVENLIALEGNGLQAGVMKLGPVSKYTCPECHGVLVQIEEDRVVRFRCHTGHAYSSESLLVEVNTAIDESLWSTLRVIEERILLLRQQAELAESGGHFSKAAGLRARAELTEKKCQPLRDLVLDSNFFAVD